MESIAVSKIMLTKILIGAGLVTPNVSSVTSEVARMNDEQASQVIMGLAPVEKKAEIEFILTQPNETLTEIQKARIESLSKEMASSLGQTQGQWD
ncbi:hypothetical protein D3C72_1511530 [compost metagenome]